MKFASGLSNLEIRGYFLFWIGVVLYSLFRVQKASNKLIRKNEHELSTGWQILNGRQKDTTDYDWLGVKYLYIEQCVWIFSHLIISEVLRARKYINLLPFFQITITVIYMFCYFDIAILPVIFAQPILFDLISKFKKKYIIWIFEILCLLFLQYCRSEYYFTNLAYERYILIHLTLYWINLRCVCYSISKVDGSTNSSIVSFFSYCLYLPLFSTGPFVDYKDFLRSQKQHDEITFYERLKKLCLNLIRFMFWIIFTDFMLHYVYVTAITFSPKVVKSFDSWTLYGFGYCMGQYFHLKYVILYGISTTLAKFENIPAPDTPKCIGRIHLYSDMWRYFDNGLYTFLVRYIYVPLQKNKIMPFFASFICFCFIFLWHGITMDILLWALLNYLCVNIEIAFRRIYNNHLSKTCDQVLNEAWKQRISCILAAPLLAVSAISNFYFFAGIDIGYIFFQRYLNGHLPMYVTLLFSLYCCCQASSYLRKRDLYQKKKVQ